MGKAPSDSPKNRSRKSPRTPNRSDRELDIAKEALREYEERVQAIIENVEDGYYQIDLEGQFIDFNDAMARIAGRPRRELMSMNARDIMDEFHSQQAFEVFENVYCTEMAAKAVDWELVRKSGSKRIVEVYPNTVRVLISGYGNDVIISQASSTHIHAFIEKPFSLIVFLEPLAPLIEKYRSGKLNPNSSAQKKNRIQHKAPSRTDTDS